jgi:hypothetical protein
MQPAHGATFGRIEPSRMNIATHPRDMHLHWLHANGTHYPMHKLIMPQPLRCHFGFVSFIDNVFFIEFSALILIKKASVLKESFRSSIELRFNVPFNVPYCTKYSATA